jgi:addiction module HigA family antidote
MAEFVAKHPTALPPLHPGEMLREEFIKPLGITPGALADRLKADPKYVRRLLREEAAITPEIARGLESIFSSSAEFWLNLQARYDEQQAK